MQDTIQELQFQLEKIQRLLSQSAETPETEEKIKRYLEKKRKIEEKLSEQQQKLAGVTRDIAAVQRGWEEKDDASGQVQAADTEEKTQTTLQSVPRFQRVTGHRKSQRSKMHRKPAFPPVKQKPHPNSQRNSLWMQQNRIQQKTTMPAK